MQIFEAPKELAVELTAFEHAIENVDSIDTMPAVVQKLLQLTADPDCGIGDIHDLVSSDPALAAKVMKVASSSAFGARAAPNLRDAMVRMGMADMRKLIMASAMTAGKQSRFSKEAWAYSMKVAVVGEAIGKAAKGATPADPFLCGLLHEFGAVLMNQVLGKKYRDAIETVGTDAQREAERTAFGFDHCDLGAMVAERWQLIRAVEFVMQLHHQPLLVTEVSDDPECHSAVYVVGLARSAVLGALEENPEATELCSRLGLSEEQLIECRDAGIERFERVYAGLIS